MGTGEKSQAELEEEYRKWKEGDGSLLTPAHVPEE
jgi:hypothetical protein|tara:strand:- start:28 stop:132 length:105 start_codon:yes stop_codon:yes gene_type:complete